MQRAFLRHVFRTRCIMKEKSDEKRDIESGVHDIVEEILHAVGQTNPEFQFSKILPSGSFYEGTKIGCLNEFDYMVVLKTLSSPDAVLLHNGCSQWYKKVQLQSSNESFQTYLLHCHTTSHLYTNYFGNRELFVLDFWRKIAETLKAKTYIVEKQSGKIAADLNPLHLKQKLYFNYEKNFCIPEVDPNYKVKNPLVPIENTVIGVDLMMAIEHPNPDEVVSCSDFPSEFKDLLFQRGCHIITKSCHIDHFPAPTCMFISFAAMELELMVKMDDHHKETYKILKSLLIGENDLSRKCMNVSSYVLKTAFLFHVYGKNKCLDSKLHVPCIHDVLDYLSSSLYNMKMPTFFARSQNTWGYILEVPCFAWPEFKTRFPTHAELTFTFALCWVKLWHTIIKYIKATIVETSNLGQDQWMGVIDKCEYMKRTTYYILERYKSSALREVFQGTLSSSDLADKNLSLCSDELFVEYVEKMEEYHNIKLRFLLF